MEPILQMRNIDKNFGQVHALKSVSFAVNPNEIVGLVGENGAGKSTLMKVLLGIHKLDGGEVLLGGKKVNFSGPHDANDHGVCMVFQEQSLLINMTVYENMFLGYEHLFSKGGLIDRKKMIEAAREELSRVGMDIDPMQQLIRLTFAQRQMVEMARNIWKARSVGAKDIIVILDEPTSALGEKDSERLFEQMTELKKFASVVFISHKLHEIVRMCDRTYVLKDGENSGILSREEATEDVIRTRMVGGSIEGEYYLTDQQRKPEERVVLEVNDLCKAGGFTNISFQLHAGEILSISGTIGSGKELLCDVLYGLTPYDSGSVSMNGQPIRPKSPSNAVRLGIGFSPDDRKGKALIMGMSVADNITIPLMRGVINLSKLADEAKGMIKKLRIKTPSERTAIRNLSGGNQQKAIIGRLILSKLDIVILSHPTRGVDVGAKREIYSLIRELADRGTAIIVMGDSFEEDIGLANTIMAMKDGACSGFLDATDTKPSLDELAKYIV